MLYKRVYLSIIFAYFTLPICFAMMDQDRYNINYDKGQSNRAYHKVGPLMKTEELITEIECDKNKIPKNKMCFCRNFYSYFFSILSRFYKTPCESPNLLLQSYIESQPKNIIAVITRFLDVISIVNLSHASRKLKGVINTEFWYQYNLTHNYQPLKKAHPYFFTCLYPWEVSSLKVAISNHHYERGLETNNSLLLKKASELGLEKASVYLLKNEETHDDTSYNYDYGVW